MITKFKEWLFKKLWPSVTVDVLQLTQERDSLKQQVEGHNRKEVIFQKELTYLRSVIEECVSEMKKEIKTRDEAIDQAMEFIADCIYQHKDSDLKQYARIISNKINTLLGRENT